MSKWPEPEPELVAHVGERQRVAITNYVNDPNLLEQDLGHEKALASGGYGRRQVAELLQNAADALLRHGAPGRVELRIAGGAFYCANEGATFDERGLTALCYAFIASKRGEEIGRFGLGFKSVLALTDNPQIFSRNVSFQFNAPGSDLVYREAGVKGEVFPVMRMPSLANAAAEAASDPHLDELMGWATTVIKLPLKREGARVRDELVDLPAAHLLFLDWVGQLDVVLASQDEKLVRRTITRTSLAGGSLVRLQDGDNEAADYAFASRRVAPSKEALQGLPETIARQEMTVSYAAPLDSRSPEMGRLWAWFPLKDLTTARGAFNAPWHLIEDRTSLVEGMSPLNRELLEVAAELFLEVATRASTPEDPAAHFDLFPARGREARSEADSFLSRRIPELAAGRPYIPDAGGTVKVADYFRRALDVDDDSVDAAGVQAWQESVKRLDVPHWKCYATPTRRARLRTLLRPSEESGRSRSEATASVWLTELAKVRTIEALTSVFSILERAPSKAGERSQLFRAEVVPLEDGGWARADATREVLLVGSDGFVPDGLQVIDRQMSAAPGLNKLLRDLGFVEVSADQTASALCARIRPTWGPKDWERLWKAVRESSPRAGIASLTAAVEAGRSVMVLDKTGNWRPAKSVFSTERFAPERDDLHADEDTHWGRADLLEAAGCINGAVPDFDLTDDPMYARYRAWIEQELAGRVKEQRAELATILWPKPVGSGPLSLLIDFASDPVAAAAWTAELISVLDSHALTLHFTVKPSKDGSYGAPSPAYWALCEAGYLHTTMGVVPFAAVASPSLGSYGAFLPVLINRELATALSLPKTLEELPDETLEYPFRRDDYSLDDVSGLVEALLVASKRSHFARPARLPASGEDGLIRLVARAEVVLAVTTDDAAELRADGTPYLLCTEEQAASLSERWGVVSSDQVLKRSLEVVEGGSENPISDLYPGLARVASHSSLPRISVRMSPRIVRKVHGPNGMREREITGVFLGDVVVVDESLDEFGMLAEISQLLKLGLTAEDIQKVLDIGQQMRLSELVSSVRSAGSEPEKMLLLADADALRSLLPENLLPSVEKRKGKQSDLDVAQLFLTVRGYDSLYMLRQIMEDAGIQVPRQWSGSPEAQKLVSALGFATAYAGTRSRRAASVAQILGKVVLNPLHDFQEELAVSVREVVLARDEKGQAARALLHLPTGAGKTRVAVESIVRLLVSEELDGPILWIAQSEELCEQAIASWTEVWRAVGDERVMEISRFFGDHELDESAQEIQIVVATDDKLRTRIGSQNADLYGWLAEASLVIIDEAHTALTPTYTEILKWLGLTASRTTRPLLGLTATAFRGRNSEVNRQFVNRFGAKRLGSATLGDDPISELRRRQVLANVDHRVLTGMHLHVSEDTDREFFRLKEVTKSMLDRIGQDHDRTQMLVADILEQDPDWPILVFAPSVVSAHTVAALLRLEGREAASIDGNMRMQERRRIISDFKNGVTKILVNCEILTQGFDAPKTRVVYVARPTFSPNRYHQMIGRGLRGPLNGGKERCLIVNVADTFDEFGEELAYTEFDYLWSAQ